MLCHAVASDESTCSIIWLLISSSPLSSRSSWLTARKCEVLSTAMGSYLETRGQQLRNSSKPWQEKKRIANPPPTPSNNALQRATFPKQPIAPLPTPQCPRAMSHESQSDLAHDAAAHEMVAHALAADDLAQRQLVVLKRRRQAQQGRAGQLGLQRRRMDAVGVQTLPNCPCLVHEAGDRDVGVRDDYVRRRDGFVLGEPPDVQLVDRVDAGDLWGG